MGRHEASERARRRLKRTRRNRRRLRRGAYLLPSLFTIGNMLLGFYAVVMAFRGSRVVVTEAADAYFVRAALAVFIAGILDTLDGRIARMTGTDSEFGREYDSLADLFTFGAAPALMTHVWGLDSFGRIGWLVPLYYMVCTATRLARFNVQTKVLDSRYFVGLPSPAAAGSVCSLLFFVPGPSGANSGRAGVRLADRRRHPRGDDLPLLEPEADRLQAPLELPRRPAAGADHPGHRPRAPRRLPGGGGGLRRLRPVAWLIGRLRRAGRRAGASLRPTPSTDPDPIPTRTPERP